MAWDAEAQGRFVAWLNERDYACPLCGTRGEFSIPDELFSWPVATPDGGTVRFDRHLVAVVLVCKVCGHLVPVNATPWIK